MLAEMKYQVVYEANDHYDESTGPYGNHRVGIRINDRVIWLFNWIFPCANNDIAKAEFEKWKKEAEFIVDCCNKEGF